MKRFLRLDWLLLFLPLAAVFHATHRPAPWIFVCAGLAIIPLAGWMGRATEHLAQRVGAGLGGLLNATFGNAAELILGAMALKRGLIDVVKASITGSILGNLLLVAGLSIVAGGMKFPHLRFNRTAANLSSTLLALSVAGLLVPAVFHMVGQSAMHSGTVSTVRERALEHGVSLEICIVLFFVYVLNLVFSLKTHKDLFAGDAETSGDHQGSWSIKKSFFVLLIATAAVAWASELLVGAVEETAHQWGLSDLFIGVIVVAVIGNAAEHSTAILMALKNKMDIAMGVAIGSSIQIALFVAPVLVFLSYAFGRPMDLRFSSFETLSVTLAAVITNMVVNDGESHWMEGVMLLALYLILGFAFYCLPA